MLLLLGVKQIYKPYNGNYAYMPNDCTIKGLIILVQIISQQVMYIIFRVIYIILRTNHFYSCLKINSEFQIPNIKNINSFCFSLLPYIYECLQSAVEKWILGCIVNAYFLSYKIFLRLNAERNCASRELLGNITTLPWYSRTYSWRGKRVTWWFKSYAEKIWHLSFLKVINAWIKFYKTLIKLPKYKVYGYNSSNQSKYLQQE